MHYYYVVRPGDTLSGIAFDFTGRASNYHYLAAVNGIFNPNYIVPGEVIWLS
jgi:nucleoid-associated protein YgaU